MRTWLKAEQFLPSLIFVVIRSCNRSVPCMEVVGYAVPVLLNVAEYDLSHSRCWKLCGHTAGAVAGVREKPDDRVAEKSTSIFTRTCCLLAVLLKTEQCAFDAQSKSSHWSFFSSLRGLLDKQKRNPCIGFPFIPEGSIKTRIVSRLKPQRVLRRDNMEEITNSLQAIQLVMDTLGIPYC